MSEVNNNINEKLISEFSIQRDELVKMIQELEVLKQKIDRLFGDNLDHKYMRFFEEKVKSATELFKTILDIRKEIIKSLKDELEFRRKIDLNNNNNNNDNPDNINYDDLAKKVELLNIAKERFKNNKNLKKIESFDEGKKQEVG